MEKRFFVTILIGCIICAIGIGTGYMMYNTSGPETGVCIYILGGLIASVGVFGDILHRKRQPY